MMMMMEHYDKTMYAEKYEEGYGYKKTSEEE
jgi:hypothetical protein